MSEANLPFRPSTVTEQSPLSNRFLEVARKAAVIGTLGAIGAVGAASASLMSANEGSLGPHRIEASLNPFSPDAELEIGGFGSFIRRTPLHVDSFDIGIKIELKEIPSGDGAVLGTNELQKYLQLFSTAGLASDLQANGRQMSERAAWYGLLGLGLGMVSYPLVGSRGRTALANGLRSGRGKALRLGLAGLLPLMGIPSDLSYTAEPVAYGNPVLEAAGWPGVKAKGLILETVVNKIGAEVVHRLQDKDHFYQGLQDAFGPSYEAQLLKEQETPSALVQRMQRGETETILWGSDMHCNLDMAAILAIVAKKMGAVLIIDSGDTTMGGTAAEKFCLKVLPEKTNHQIPILFAPGNHDSSTTIQQATDVGYYSFDRNKIIEIAGYKIAGGPDHMRSAPGVPYHLEGTETPQQQSKELAKIACEAGGVNLAVLHEAKTDIVEQGCASFLLSGHIHIIKPPVQHKAPTVAPYTIAYNMINGTTGGGEEGQFTFMSKLGKDATMIQLICDKQTKKPLGYRVITFTKAGAVQVGPATGLDYGQPAAAPIRPLSKAGTPSK
jgi:hypothetical protein